MTGRKRRCGWLDLAALKRSIIINGVSGLCITKLGRARRPEELKLCTGYMLDGKRIDLLPMGSRGGRALRADPRDHAGLVGTTFGAQTWDALPPEARAYLHRIEEICEVSIDVISTGPERTRPSSSATLRRLIGRCDQTVIPGGPIRAAGGRAARPEFHPARIPSLGKRPGTVAMSNWLRAWRKNRGRLIDRFFYVGLCPEEDSNLHASRH